MDGSLDATNLPQVKGYLSAFFECMHTFTGLVYLSGVSNLEWPVLFSNFSDGTRKATVFQIFPVDLRENKKARKGLEMP